jgi:arylsulfatase A-like enzyme
VVLVADHGEDFLEHGDLMHCRTVFETSIHVPLVLWLPGVRGRRLASPVQVLDVVPTVLDYLGIDASQYGFEGRSLRPAIEGGSWSEPAYAAQSSFRALLDGRDKAIYDLSTGTTRLFDVAADPGETTDLAAARPDAARALTARILEQISANEGEGGTQRAERVSRQVQDRLRALGYLQ